MQSIVEIFVRKPLFDLAHQPHGNVASLDALRSVAVFLVIMGHSSKAFVECGGSENWFGRLPVVTGGRIGVDLFFVLSGYLIGGQLWRELGAHGKVDFSRFIIRRGFRIWPLYFFFFAFVTLVLRRGEGLRGWSDVIFVTNYVNQGVVMGSWSLCIEEQFYIIAPLLICIGTTLDWSMRRYGAIFLGLLVLLPAIRLLTWWVLTGDFQHRNQEVFAQYIYTPFHTHADGLVVGLLIAWYRFVFKERANTGILASSATIIGTALLIVVGHTLQREVFDFTTISLLFGAIVQFLLSQKLKWLGVFKWSGFYLISRLSYGMYLNHEYIQDWVARFGILWLPLPDSMAAVKNIICVAMLTSISAAVALVTYCVVEHPFLQLRDSVLSRRNKYAASTQLARS